MTSQNMSKFKSTLEAADCLGLLREVCVGSQQYLCSTRYSEADAQWLIGAADGVDVWQVGLSEQDVKDDSHERGESGYLSDLSHTLANGDVQLLKLHDRLTLCLKCASEQVEFSLFEVPAAERRLEMKTLLFSVWDRLKDTQTKLKVCEKDLTEALKQKAPEQPLFADVTTRGGIGKAAASRPKKAAGASLVNPSSKRRKKATGVVFGDNDS